MQTWLYCVSYELTTGAALYLRGSQKLQPILQGFKTDPQKISGPAILYATLPIPLSLGLSIANVRLPLHFFPPL